VKGVNVAIQRSQNGSWHTVATVQTAADGSYDAPLDSAGTYRIVYRGLDGPAIVVR
jgi:5-hydroxyisourate hydrolase-like protein (transthyretin family)